VNKLSQYSNSTNSRNQKICPDNPLDDSKDTMGIATHHLHLLPQYSQNQPLADVFEPAGGEVAA